MIYLMELDLGRTVCKKHDEDIDKCPLQESPGERKVWEWKQPKVSQTWDRKITSRRVCCQNPGFLCPSAKQNYGERKSGFITLPGNGGTQKASTSKTVPFSQGNRERFCSQGSWSGVGEKDQRDESCIFPFFCKIHGQASISNSLVPLRLSACDLSVLKYKTVTRELRGRRTLGAEHNSYRVRQ